MATKSDQLKTDISRLEKSIGTLESRLAEIDSGTSKTSDPGEVTTLIDSKDRAVAKLDQKRAELKIEQENAKSKNFGGRILNADSIARLSIGGSLKSSSLDKTSLDDAGKLRLIDDLIKKGKDEKEREELLLEQGFIVQRKM